ncbi:hypothetical protein ACP4OV_017080 [Aristida adscensionis]
MAAAIAAVQAAAAGGDDLDPQLSLMAASDGDGDGDGERREELLLLPAMAVRTGTAARCRGSSEHREAEPLLLMAMMAVTVSPARPAPAGTLDPRLLMAARRGDSQQLKKLLEYGGGEQAGTDHAAAGAGTADMMRSPRWWTWAALRQRFRAICKVDHHHQPPAAAEHQDQVVLDVVRANDHHQPLADPRPTSSSLLRLLDGVTGSERGSLLHVVVAGAARAADADDDDDGKQHFLPDRDFLRCARMIYSGKKDLLVACNDEGDTPLHCAAAAGHVEMVSCLIDLATAGETAAVEKLLRTRNKSGETALHQAVRARSTPCIDKLLSKDPELAGFAVLGEDGASPFYLAVSLGHMDIAKHLFDTVSREVKKLEPASQHLFDKKKAGKPSYSGPDRRNVLHAAVSRGQALRELLEWFKPVKEDGTCLLPDLTTQRDKDGNTPLHLAASLEGWPGARKLTKCFPSVWAQSKSTIEMLLGDSNQCAAYQPDNKGLYPIHVAALVGSLESVKALLEKCPECATLCDGKGRTFLHVAVEKERHKVVEYVCGKRHLFAWVLRGPPKKEFASVLNMQDNNGDTALHRAVDVGNLHVFNRLIRNQIVRLDIPNKDGLTPLDLAWRKNPKIFYYKWSPRYTIHSSLQYLKAPCGGTRADIFKKNYIPTRNEEEESKNLTKATNVMGIVSVLVATMAFTAAFTFPGGYYQSANDGVPGAPILGGRYAFDAFVIANGLTFACSCLATFSLIFSGLPVMDLSMRHKSFYRSAALLHSSLVSFAIAFSLGLYLLLAPVSRALTIMDFAVCCSASLLGQIPGLNVIRVAYTAYIRSAISLKTTWVHLRRFFRAALLPKWSTVLIFGVPLIIRLINKLQLL